MIPQKKIEMKLLMKCIQCGKAFLHHRNLKLHKLIIHEKVKFVPCKEYCKLFTKDNFDKHNSEIHNYQPCDKTLDVENDLYLHKELIPTCEKCNKTFKISCVINVI